MPILTCRALEPGEWALPQSCRWRGCSILMSHRLIVCYEMAEEFVQLYGGQTADRKPAPLAANDPIARNIKTLAVQQGAPAQESAPAVTEPSVKTSAGARLEQLAQALTTQTVDFFARPSRQEPTKPGPAVRQAQK
jgi:hypothetical protein